MTLSTVSGTAFFEQTWPSRSHNENCCEHIDLDDLQAGCDILSRFFERAAEDLNEEKLSWPVEYRIVTAYNVTLGRIIDLKA